MILLNSLFYLRELRFEKEEIHALLNINANHEILSGHFPGFPVMPGVCMMQITREVFDKATGFSVRIVKGDNIKFLAVLDPGQYRDVKLSISYKAVDSAFDITASIISVSAVPADGMPITFFKFKGIYREESSFKQ